MTETAQMSPPPALPAKNTVAALSLAAATVAIALGGLGIVFTNVLSLLAPPSFPGAPAPIHDAVVVAGMMVLFGSTTVAFIAFMLIRLFTRIMGLPSASEGRAQVKKRVASEYQPAQLAPPPASVSSVTEHTTRTFRPPAYDEVKTRE